MITATILARPTIRESKLFSTMYADFVEDAPWVQERFDCNFRQTECWGRLADRSRDLMAPSSFWKELTGYHKRLGASDQSLKNLQVLSSGEAVAVVSGQQPTALGGPLYTIHKAATSVALAQSFESKTGRRAVPVFWVASEDSDFEEIRTVRFFGSELEAREHSIDKKENFPQQMVGEISLAALRPTWDAALSSWESLPGHGIAQGWLREIAETAHDLGEVQAGLLLRALSRSGLVIVEPRLPSFRKAARPLYARYLERHSEVQECVDEAGSTLENLGFARPIPELTSQFSLYRVENGARIKTDLSGARAAIDKKHPLTGNVVLRPIVQDALIPTVLQLVGPGEAGYLSQMRKAYAVLQVPMPTPFPRATASWVPPAALALIREQGIDPWALVREPDATLREMYEQMVPEISKQELESLRRSSFEALDSLAETIRSIDGSLPQMVESARGKIDYQYKRLQEGITGKLRQRYERSHPQVGRLRQMLLPKDRPQERSLGWLDLVARRGGEFFDQLDGLAQLHVETVLAGGGAHFVVPLESEGEVR